MRRKRWIRFVWRMDLSREVRLNLRLQRQRPMSLKCISKPHSSYSRKSTPPPRQTILMGSVTDVQSRCIGLDFGKLSIKNAVREPMNLSTLRKLSVPELHDRAADIYSIDVENVQVALSSSVPSLTLHGAEGWNATQHIVPKISLKSFCKLAFRPPKTIPRAEISAIAEKIGRAHV